MIPNVSLMLKTENLYLSFPLIPPSFVKLVEVDHFDKTSHPLQFMELVIVWGTGGTEISVFCQSIRLIIQRPAFNPYQFWFSV